MHCVKWDYPQLLANVNVTTIDGIYEYGQYRHGYEIRIQCHQGFLFPDGSTEKKSQCVGVEWSFLDSCYPSNYIKFNIIKISTDLYQMVN